MACSRSSSLALYDKLPTNNRVVSSVPSVVRSRAVLNGQNSRSVGSSLTNREVVMDMAR